MAQHDQVQIAVAIAIPIRHVPEPAITDFREHLDLEFWPYRPNRCHCFTASREHDLVLAIARQIASKHLQEYPCGRLIGAYLHRANNLPTGGA